MSNQWDFDLSHSSVNFHVRHLMVSKVHGRFTTCAPWLGSPAGASPACNRILVRNGTATADVPMGRFDVYAFHGPYWSIAKQTVDVTGGPQQLTFTLRDLGLKLATRGPLARRG